MALEVRAGMRVDHPFHTPTSSTPRLYKSEPRHRREPVGVYSFCPSRTDSSDVAALTLSVRSDAMLRAGSS
jgi:hypothetical protein